MEISEDVQGMLNAAYLDARERKHEYITPEHILYASLYFDLPRQIIHACGIEPEELRIELEEHLKHNIPVADNAEPIQTVGFQDVIERAVVHTESSSKQILDLGDILVSIFDEEKSFSSYYMKRAGLNRLNLLEKISHGVYEDDEDLLFDAEELEPYQFFDTEENATPLPVTEPQEQPQKNPLHAYTRDLTEEASQGLLQSFIGRRDLLNRISEVLCRKLKNNPILVGDPGTGKTALAEGLALLVVSDKCPSFLKDYRILSLDMGSVIAGTRFRGDFEDRLKKIIFEVEKIKRVVLFIDEIHTIIGAGSVSGGSLDAANLLKPVLAQGKIRCIGSTTHKEFKKSFENEQALLRRFQKIDVPETDREETLDILRGLKAEFEEHHEVVYAEGSLEAAVDLSKQYINDRFHPDSAIDVIDEAAAWMRVHSEPPHNIEVSDIERIVSRISNLPQKSVSSTEADRLRELGNDLQNDIFGQDEALTAIVRAVRRGRAGFKNPDKPVASFLFAGPTGVGKTETARSLAEALSMPLHRFDMSEYQEKHTVARLIGSPPGYVGFEEGGQLTDLIRRTPHAVLLLDEIEKAHQDIFNVLLQIMDYATLTDNNGKKADFRNVILIMTSNAGARDVGKAMIGFGSNEITESAINTAVEKTFSPEFRNRLDSVIRFNRLDKSVILKIVDKEILLFKKQLEEKNVELEVTEACRNYLAEKGYSYEFGARNISRLIQDEIKTFFVDEVLFGRLTSGGKTVADIVDGMVEIRVI
ncbi:MAG: ATP-dependent Clp protease ATP-binding subunit ClpA [Spirochaetales bacterium]|uniref:ATP-dependent Clp protease ATP-binding subunit ClpA n=1 Tax=Candidatus Thalassospirochaeta sargassi TaxID=3119039 RepID=A0AAJ1MHI3_9SPIO|nr:ATP-dependent Clp protease ATP-binding subunit ClpA [Spirochaetales bacterium]